MKKFILYKIVLAELLTFLVLVSSAQAKDKLASQLYCSNIKYVFSDYINESEKCYEISKANNISESLSENNQEPSVQTIKDESFIYKKDIDDVLGHKFSGFAFVLTGILSFDKYINYNSINTSGKPDKSVFLDLGIIFSLWSVYEFHSYHKNKKKIEGNKRIYEFAQKGHMSKKEFQELASSNNACVNIKILIAAIAINYITNIK